MRRRRVGVVDLVGNRPAPGLWNRLMKPNFASIMPQVVAVWCEQTGHDVTFVCHTGREDLTRELPSDLDVLFISAFTDVTNCGAPEGCSAVAPAARSPTAWRTVPPRLARRRR